MLLGNPYIEKIKSKLNAFGTNKVDIFFRVSYKSRVFLTNVFLRVSYKSRVLLVYRPSEFMVKYGVSRRSHSPIQILFSCQNTTSVCFS